MTRKPDSSSTDRAPMPGDAGWSDWLEARTVSAEGIDIALIRENR